MGGNVQTPSHQGLNAWFEVLRTEREGLMPKYWVYQVRGSIHCSHPECKPLTIGALRPMGWVERQRIGTNYLYTCRHSDACPWQKQVHKGSQNSFTSQPLERAYVYWAQLEHKFNHI